MSRSTDTIVRTTSRITVLSPTANQPQNKTYFIVADSCFETIDEDSRWAEFAFPSTTLALGEASPQMPFTPGENGSGVAMAVDDVEIATEELKIHRM